MGVAGFALFASGCGEKSHTVRANAISNGPMASLQDIGPLLPPDENAIMLPRGFKSRVVARSGVRSAANSDYVWHGAPDGGACFASDDGGWIYVSNAELRSEQGGVGALRFDANGNVIDSYPILEGTSVNCAGGKTPWQTWLSCEETDQGQVFECDPFGDRPAIVRSALGTFEHEAVAVDPLNQILYLTEDKPDGGFYRFRPHNDLPDLSSGTLEVALLKQQGKTNYLSWKQITDPLAREIPVRKQVPDYAPFNGGEGLVYQEGRVYFSTKGDNRVWCYNVANKEIFVVYDVATSKNPILSGVDNLSITPAGDVLVAEDKGNMQIVLLTSDDKVIPLMQIVGHERSEITGPAFDPAFKRLYFSSQRGSEGVNGSGITYEISVV
ncbi:MAG: DUF839 domain-containing protein [Gammaproteobacteria bacterium]|nr:DUF839 domain-containing protein [Gammaproteobacteria bacterium]